jgi:hypothetical protein
VSYLMEPTVMFHLLKREGGSDVINAAVPIMTSPWEVLGPKRAHEISTPDGGWG